MSDLGYVETADVLRECIDTFLQNIEDRLGVDNFDKANFKRINLGDLLDSLEKCAEWDYDK